MTKLAGDHVQVLVGGYELTGDSNKISISDARDMLDVTAFGDAVHKFIGGKRLISLDHSGYLEAQAARSHPVLKSGEFSGIVSVLLGQNAAPAVGDPMYSVGTVQGNYQSLMEAGKHVPFNTKFAMLGNLGGWGKALAVPVTFTSPTNGAAVNNGAASSNGGAAYLHVLQAGSNGVYNFTIEGSTTGAFSGEQTTLATFNDLHGTALGSERVALAGTIPQYTRWKAALASGSAGETIKISVNLVRF